ncbi:MAG: SH3 domain-containing protein [Coriobacteriia bacterium]
MRTDREPEPGYEEPVHRAPDHPVRRDPYADLYHEEEQPFLVRALRVVIPWIALIAVVTVILSLWSEFRFESQRVTPQGESTVTVEPTETAGSGVATGTAPTDAPYVRVKAEGLNMRAAASTDSDVLRKLPSGTVLVYVESANGWYHVRDDAGADGWVAAGGSFTELVTP